MERFVVRVLFFFGMLVSFLVNAADLSEGLGQFTTSVGADLQSRYMKFEKNRAPGTIAKPHMIQGSGHIAFNFPWFGLELGYESSRQDVGGLLTPSDHYFGERLGGNADLEMAAKTTIRGPYANLTGFLPISEEYRLQGLCFIGMGRLHTKVVSIIPAADVENIFSKRTWIPRAGVGIQHTLNKNDSFGIRAMVAWEQTSRFREMLPTEETATPIYASLRNSVIPSLGVFYNF